MSDLEAALARVRHVFAARQPPTHLEYCAHCYSKREMAHLLQTPPHQLTGDVLRGPLWDAYHQWGDWPSLAYYLPRIFDLYLAGEMDEEEMLFAKLVIGTRPELQPDARVTEPMSEEERRALHAFLIAWVETRRAEAYERTEWPEGLAERFAIAAALDGPIRELVLRWKEGEPHDRAFWCGILTGFLERDYASKRALPNLYLDGMTAHPENEALLLAEADPEAAIVYLVNHLEAVPLYGDELLVRVEKAVGIR